VTSSPQVDRSPWRQRRFLSFASGNLINNIGDAAFSVTLPLLVYHLTHSFTVMSVFAVFAPISLVLGPLLGTVTDRWGSRLFVVPGLVVQLVSAVGLNILVLSGHVVLAAFVGLVAVIELGGGLYRFGWMVGVSKLFPANPGRARGALSTLYLAAVVIGPLLTAVLLGKIGYIGLLWFNVATYAAPIVVWYAGVQPITSVGEVAPARWRPFRELRAGWIALRGNLVVYRTTILLVPLSLVTSSGTTALVIFYFRRSLGLSASSVAILIAVASLASVLTSLAVSEVSRLKIRVFLTAGFGAVALGLFFMAVPALPLIIAAFVAFTGAQSCVYTGSGILLFNLVPADLIGRTSGIQRLAAGAPEMVAPLILAGLVVSLGVVPILLLLGAVALVPAILMVWWYRRFATAGAPTVLPEGGDA